MWKILAGFILFAVLGMLVILKGGDKVSLAGEAEEHKEVASVSSPEPAQINPAQAAAPTSDQAAVEQTTRSVNEGQSNAASATKMSTTGTVVVGTTSPVSK